MSKNDRKDSKERDTEELDEQNPIFNSSIDINDEIIPKRPPMKDISIDFPETESETNERKIAEWVSRYHNIYGKGLAIYEENIAGYTLEEWESWYSANKLQIDQDEAASQAPHKAAEVNQSEVDALNDKGNKEREKLKNELKYIKEAETRLEKDEVKLKQVEKSKLSIKKKIEETKGSIKLATKLKDEVRLKELLADKKAFEMDLNKFEQEAILKRKGIIEREKEIKRMMKVVDPTIRLYNEEEIRKAKDDKISSGFTKKITAAIKSVEQIGDDIGDTCTRLDKNRIEKQQLQAYKDKMVTFQSEREESIKVIKGILKRGYGIAWDGESKKALTSACTKLKRAMLDQDEYMPRLAKNSLNPNLFKQFKDKGIKHTSIKYYKDDIESEAEKLVETYDKPTLINRIFNVGAKTHGKSIDDQAKILNKVFSAREKSLNNEIVREEKNLSYAEKAMAAMLSTLQKTQGAVEKYFNERSNISTVKGYRLDARSNLLKGAEMGMAKIEQEVRESEALEAWNKASVAIKGKSAAEKGKSKMIDFEGKTGAVIKSSVDQIIADVRIANVISAKSEQRPERTHGLQRVKNEEKIRK